MKLLTIQKTIVLIHLFYALSLLIFFKKLTMLLIGSHTFPPLPVEIISIIPNSIWPTFCRSIGLFGLVSLVATMIYPWSRLSRIFAFGCCLFTIAIFSSHGKVIHGQYSYIWVLAILIFLPNIPKEQKTDLKVIHIFYIAQFSSLLCYAQAGMWKIKKLVLMIIDGHFTQYLSGLSNTIAFEHIKNHSKLDAISLYFIEHTTLTGSLFILLIFIQFLVPYLFFFKHLHFYIGLVLILFHIMSEIIVNIPFRAQLYLVLLFFILSPYNARFNKFYSFINKSYQHIKRSFIYQQDKINRNN